MYSMSTPGHDPPELHNLGLDESVVAQPIFPPRRVPLSSLWSSAQDSRVGHRSVGDQNTGSSMQQFALMDFGRDNLGNPAPGQSSEKRVIQPQALHTCPPRRVAVSSLWSGHSSSGNILDSTQRAERRVQERSVSSDVHENTGLLSPMTPSAAAHHCCGSSSVNDSMDAFLVGFLAPAEAIQSLAGRVLQTAQDTVVAFLQSLMTQRLVDGPGNGTPTTTASGSTPADLEEESLVQPNNLINCKHRNLNVWNPDYISVNPEEFSKPGILVVATNPEKQVKAFVEWKEVEEYSFHFGRYKIYAFNSNGDLFKHEGRGQIHWERQGRPAPGTQLRSQEGQT